MLINDFIIQSAAYMTRAYTYFASGRATLETFHNEKVKLIIEKLKS